MAINDRRGLENALTAIEDQLVLDATNLDLQVQRAGLLAALAHTELARQAYLAVLRQDPTHFAALINFGVLLHETNFTTAARTLFGEAVARHPGEPLAHVNLANILMYDDELNLARSHLETALSLDPDNIHAHQRLSGILHELGDTAGMQRHRQLGFAGQPTQSFPYLGDGEGVPLVVLTSTPGGDIAWTKLIDPYRFAVTSVVAAFHDPEAPLPPHRLILNAIGDADLSGSDLTAAAALTAGSAAPVLNDPIRVLATGRQANAARLGDLPGVVAPRMVQVSRAELADDGVVDRLALEGLHFPLLLRSLGFHTGRNFVRVDEPQRLAGVAATLPGLNLNVIERLDARGADGLSRKYRVMMINGALYPLHLAIATDWKVHYATAAMADNPALREEEARFLDDMPRVLGERCMEALENVQTVLGLDYAGVDFAVSRTGDLLLFEANAVMNIIPPDDAAQWDYRRNAVARALAAARDMFAQRAASRS